MKESWRPCSPGPAGRPAAAAGRTATTAAAAVASGGPSQGKCRVKPALDMLHVKAELLKRLMSRFVRSHETAWLSVRTVKSERTPEAG